jgi:hypothetical protein
MICCTMPAVCVCVSKGIILLINKNEYCKHIKYYKILQINRKKTFNFLIIK